MDNKIELPEEYDFRPSAARLVESLRDTGYSKEAAFADIIDNSIAAGATKILVELQYMFGDFKVIITDNGSGMREDELRAAMRYGSPKRENPKSLGKFGMGLKTASTAFCRRLVVLSIKDSEKAVRAWDLDQIIETDRWELETPSDRSYLDEFEDLNEFCSDSGTMIIWEKIDRLINAGNEKQINIQIEALGEDLSDELNAIFGKFISSGDIQIKMKVGEHPAYSLEGWDPLCSNLNAGGEGARARLLSEKIISINDTEKFTVKGSIIPSKDELTSKEEKLVRYNLDNQGLYIYREGRLIWHDGWPHRMYKKESKITRLRVELNFGHELDDVFSIDFRKSRVIIPSQIRGKLKELIAPWRNEVLRRQTPSEGGNEKPDRDHSASNKAIEKHKDNTKNAHINVEGNKATITNNRQRTPTPIDNVRIYEDSTIRVYEEDSLNGACLWEPAIDEEGNTCVSIGKSHPYFSKLYSVCKDDSNAIKALDMLLWSLAHAEYGEYSESNKTTLLGYRHQVSQSLNYLSLELPDNDEV